MKIGFTELILVAFVAFVVIGPDKLPEYARKLGKMLRELKKYTGAASEEIQKNVVEPLNEIQAPIKEAVAPLCGLPCCYCTGDAARCAPLLPYVYRKCVNFK